MRVDWIAYFCAAKQKNKIQIHISHYLNGKTKQISTRKHIWSPPVLHHPGENEIHIHAHRTQRIWYKNILEMTWKHPALAESTSGDANYVAATIDKRSQKKYMIKSCIRLMFYVWRKFTELSISVKCNHVAFSPSFDINFSSNWAKWSLGTFWMIFAMDFLSWSEAFWTITWKPVWQSVTYSAIAS